MRFQDIVQSSGVKSLDPSTRYKSLLPQHCRYLSDRGILPETAAAAGIHSARQVVMENRTGQLVSGRWPMGYLRWKSPAPELGSGLIFPYHDHRGEPHSFCIARPDHGEWAAFSPAALFAAGSSPGESRSVSSSSRREAPASRLLLRRHSTS